MSDLTDTQLREQLKSFGVTAVVTPSTRSVLVKKLEKLRKEKPAATPPEPIVNGIATKKSLAGHHAAAVPDDGSPRRRRPATGASKQNNTHFSGDELSDDAIDARNPPKILRSGSKRQSTGRQMNGGLEDDEANKSFDRGNAIIPGMANRSRTPPPIQRTTSKSKTTTPSPDVIPPSPTRRGAAAAVIKKGSPTTAKSKASPPPLKSYATADTPASQAEKSRVFLFSSSSGGDRTSPISAAEQNKKLSSAFRFSDSEGRDDDDSDIEDSPPATVNRSSNTSFLPSSLRATPAAPTSQSRSSFGRLTTPIIPSPPSSATKPRSSLLADSLASGVDTPGASTRLRSALAAGRNVPISPSSFYGSPAQSPGARGSAFGTPASVLPPTRSYGTAGGGTYGSFASGPTTATKGGQAFYQRPGATGSSGWSSPLTSLNQFRHNMYEKIKEQTVGRLTAGGGGKGANGSATRDDWSGARHRGGGGGVSTSTPVDRWKLATPASNEFLYSDDLDEPPRRWLSWTDQTVVGALVALVIGIGLFYCAIVYNEHLSVAADVVGAAVDTTHFLYKHLVLPLVIICVVVGVIVGGFLWQRHRWHKQAEYQSMVYEMVEQIINTIRDHHDRGVSAGEKDPFLAIPHVRDMLIEPSKKRQMQPVWDAAVEYLKANESRLREESQFISGEEFLVWRWLQTTRHSPTAASPAATTAAGGSDSSAAPGKGWQGLAFPEEQIPLNMPRTAYTECLKARGLFDPTTETSKDWPLNVKREVLMKIGPRVKVVHLSIDMVAKEGCVYIKCASKEDAGVAYMALHGSWFNGHLVSVKYVRPERYHERFPDAKDANIPLRM